MANESVKSRYAKVRPAKVKRRSGSRTFQFVLASILVVGTGLVAAAVIENARDRSTGPRANRDHWHAYFGVNICGVEQPTHPAFDAEDGVHAHSGSNRLIHFHPYSTSGSGSNATIGRFLENGSENVSDPTSGTPGQAGGWTTKSDSFTLWNGADGTQIKVKNGDLCKGPELAAYEATATSTTTTSSTSAPASDGSDDSSSSSSSTTTTTTTTTSSTSAPAAADVADKKGVVRWAVAKNIRSKLVEKFGDVADYKPANGEIVVLYFLPKDAPLVMPSDVREAFLTSDEGEGGVAPGSIAQTSTVITETPSSEAPVSTPSIGAAP